MRTLLLALSLVIVLPAAANMPPPPPDPVPPPTSAVPAPPLAPTYADQGLAIRGYDPIAYFEDGAPTPGSPEHSLEWSGATWRFTSAGRLAQFQADPTAWAPQYGGYCAWAVSQGRTASTDPSAWKIVGGLLYLNYSKNIQKRWSNDIPTNIQRGDANWPQLLAGEDPIYPAE